ncbi:MAG: glycerophosphodiester phosphodiesterase family protein [Proteobacteria bacterium]|nr:glycerophosphodiester phosphodiesterase family protein [Pseudomonadota bacterium]
MWIIGHRGAAGMWPENTLIAIDHALAVGADWVEIDIRLVDGELIVLHDETLDRTTNGFGSVYQHSLSKIRALDAGQGQLVPMLDEVLDLIDARAGLNIEIKQSGLNEQLRALLKRYLTAQPRWRNQLMISSFISEVIRDFSAAPPAGCLLGALTESDPELSIRHAARSNFFSINLSVQQLSTALVAAAHIQGLKVLVYTVNTPEQMQRCADLSVDGIFTDYPERAIAFFDKLLTI